MWKPDRFIFLMHQFSAGHPLAQKSSGDLIAYSVSLAVTCLLSSARALISIVFHNLLLCSPGPALAQAGSVFWVRRYYHVLPEVSLLFPLPSDFPNTIFLQVLSSSASSTKLSFSLPFSLTSPLSQLRLLVLLVTRVTPCSGFSESALDAHTVCPLVRHFGLRFSA